MPPAGVEKKRSKEREICCRMERLAEKLLSKKSRRKSEFGVNHFRRSNKIFDPEKHNQIQGNQQRISQWEFYVN